MYIRMYTCLYIHMYINLYIDMYIHMYTYMHIHMYIYATISPMESPFTAKPSRFWQTGTPASRPLLGQDDPAKLTDMCTARLPIQPMVASFSNTSYLSHLQPPIPFL